MDELHESLIETFRSETNELLAILESSLLELESDPDNMELVNQVFRALHTIKGNGAMFGFEVISSFTHDIESMYDLIRSGEMAVTREIIDLTLSSKDIIIEMMEDPSLSDEQLKLNSDNILSRLARIISGQEAETTKEEKVEAGPSRAEDLKTYRIRFAPSQDIFCTGTNPVLLLDELREMGQCTVVPKLGAIPPLDKYEPEKCYTSWDIFLTTEQTINAVRDIFIFVEDRCELKIDVIDEEAQLEELENLKLGDILVKRGDLEKRSLQEVLDDHSPVGRELVVRNLVNQEDIESALIEQDVVKEARRKRRAAEASSSIRVASEKLDSLVDLVGELVTVQARLSRVADKEDNPELATVAEQIEFLTWELRDNAFNIRMVPVGTIFGSMRRLVRDISNEMGKEVVLQTEGAETELDKTVIENLKDPLVHLIRNSIDHGIESPDEREAAGKNRCGTILLRAYQAGADVILEISDDGRGLDRDAIVDRAVKKGILSPDADLSDQEVFSMIFMPAFSTARTVTSVSGRGVGMDIVKKAVETLRGYVTTESERGKGTSVYIRLPITLAIIDGLEVDLGGDRFIFPLSLVEECIELRGDDAGQVKGRNLVRLREDLVPYIHLRECFSIKGDRPPIEQIVITRNGDNLVGFVVDNVIGEHQTVIKSLGRVYRQVEGISGATILGDGTVALILDVPKLIGIMEEKSVSRTGDVHIDGRGKTGKKKQ